MALSISFELDPEIRKELEAVQADLRARQAKAKKVVSKVGARITTEPCIDCREAGTTHKGQPVRLFYRYDMNTATAGLQVVKLTCKKCRRNVAMMLTADQLAELTGDA